MTNKPMLSVERDAFEAFWRATMNVEVMDLHRCEFPMTAYNDQPYACHETDRAWMTWKGRALIDNQAAQRQGEPVLFVCPDDLTNENFIGISGKFKRDTVHVQPLYSEYPEPVPALITDEQILEAMRKSIASADGGYVVDTAPQDVIAAGRALLAEVARLNWVKL